MKRALNELFLLGERPNGATHAVWGAPQMRPAADGGDDDGARIVTVPLTLETATAGRFEMRPVEFVSSWDPTPRPASRAVWLRVKGSLPDELAVHQRLLAYMSDWCMLETALFPHDVALWQPRVRVSSLTHTMHFHQPFRIDEWLIHVIESPSASGARGFARGEVWSESGVLVASTSQEGLMRPVAAQTARRCACRAPGWA